MSRSSLYHQGQHPTDNRSTFTIWVDRHLYLTGVVRRQIQNPNSGGAWIVCEK
ncbi:MAG: hypothetical protein N3E45_04480 [Oscillatoriaceae bacterium SKW80]|nr:hypothetical protein [Oscillatoriaceae bacterium SKW80]HIK29540.1 hypothetical protein [Oscillatoriaceae cyanobacterium M7585_C2015_266]